MQQKHLTWILLLGALGTILIGAGVLYAVGILRPAVSVLQPQAIPTPDPAIAGVEVIEVVTTPQPEGATPTPAPTHAQYPATAVNLIVNGTPLMALSNREVGIRLLEEYLSICSSENLSETEHLIRAYIDADVTTGIVDGSVEYVTYDVALQRLLNNRTLVPVVRSVERAEMIVSHLETENAAQPSLPVGDRFIRSFGHAEHLFGLNETLYKSGIAVSASQTLPLTRVGSDPAAIVIEQGTQTYAEDPATETTRNPVGKDAGELQFNAPCRGEVISYFGMRYGAMHYGVDYAMRPGDQILAPESGTVIYSGRRGDYGWVIEIRHAGGFISRLTHCANPQVELEQHVFRGDPIAVLALDENDPEPHLHYELLIDNIPYDPLQYIK